MGEGQPVVLTIALRRDAPQERADAARQPMRVAYTTSTATIRSVSGSMITISSR